MRVSHARTLTGHPTQGVRDPRANVSPKRVTTDLTAREFPGLSSVGKAFRESDPL
ncbi:hypothetical protein GCM10010411_07960 [Actinomadura fulvescens]|uniref:Uncharacterized protein n=1 Tax=Actinomadura fulvescens TaxID=46160 RepID=A0ABN3PBS1_9ACTN